MLIILNRLYRQTRLTKQQYRTLRGQINAGDLSGTEKGLNRLLQKEAYETIVINNVYNMDCLEGMNLIPDGSIDMILCDLPYGTTDCKWDKSIIPFSALWEQYNRIIKESGVIVLTSAQPFTTQLIQSNLKMFRYCWYWVKNTATGFCFAKVQPMRKVEEVCVFYKKAPTYNPQGLKKVENPRIRKRKPTQGHPEDWVYRSTLNGEYTTKWTNYPNNVLQIKSERGLHPTQKPVELFEYLIKTYTHEGETVLDNCMGSGTTAIACRNTNRNYIGFEKDTGYYEIIQNRIREHQVER